MADLPTLVLIGCVTYFSSFTNSIGFNISNLVFEHDHFQITGDECELKHFNFSSTHTLLVSWTCGVIYISLIQVGSACEMGQLVANQYGPYLGSDGPCL